MKKLEKLTLKEIENEFLVIPEVQQQQLRGGDYGGYCVFSAMGQIGQQLGCGPSSFNDAAAGYGTAYGSTALLQSWDGLSSDRTESYLKVYYNVTEISPSNYTQAGSHNATMGILNVGSGGGHAVVMNGTCNGQYLYIDNDGTLHAADSSQFFVMYNVSCH